MKKKTLYGLLTVVADAALITCAVLSVPCAVLTAYDLPFALAPLVWAAILIGLTLSIWMQVKKYGYAAGILYFSVWIPLLLWQRRSILYGFRLVRFAMLDMLSPDVPFLPAPRAVEPIEGLAVSASAAVTWFGLLVMALFGLTIAWSLIRSKMVLLPLIVPLPIFMLSLIYTDLPLAHWTVFLLLLYLGCSLISGGLRVNDAQKYGLVTLIALTALLLLGAILYAVSPPETYEPISFEQRQQMMGEQVQNLYDDVKSALNNRVKRTEDLTDEAEWHRTGETILELQTSANGETYLRAYSLGRYEKNAWRSVSNNTGNWHSMAALGNNAARADGDEAETMSIRAERAEMLYVPYGFDPQGIETTGESYLAANSATEYAWDYRDVVPEASAVSADEAAYIDWAKAQYRIADDAEKTALLAFAEQAGLSDTGDHYRTAQLVAEYVRTHAEYTTTPGSIPDGADFVLYFLTESKRGYCVHFASATTALLDAMGIPARYVFGYRFYAVGGTWKTVTDEMAHAWTEVYCPGIGWVRVESTAGAEGWEEPDAMQQMQPASPTPNPTAEPTETPEPTPQETEIPEGLGEEQEPTENPTSEPTAIPTDPLTEEPKENAAEETDLSASAGEDPKKRSGFWHLLWLLLPPGIVGVLYGTGRFLTERRRRAFEQKNAKKAVLALYRVQKRMERFGAPQSDRAEELAEEAMFSNHTMTEERRIMHKIVKASHASLETAPWWKRFLLQWVLFVLDMPVNPFKKRTAP